MLGTEWEGERKKEGEITRSTGAMLRWMYGVTGMNMIRSDRGIMKIASVTETAGFHYRTTVHT